MAKKGYPTKEAAEQAAVQANALAPQLLPKYVPWEYHDPVTGERKWFIRRERRR